MYKNIQYITLLQSESLRDIKGRIVDTQIKIYNI